MSALPPHTGLPEPPPPGAAARAGRAARRAAPRRRRRAAAPVVPPPAAPPPPPRRSCRRRPAAPPPAAGTVPATPAAARPSRRCPRDRRRPCPRLPRRYRWRPRPRRRSGARWCRRCRTRPRCPNCRPRRAGDASPAPPLRVAAAARRCPCRSRRRSRSHRRCRSYRRCRWCCPRRRQRSRHSACRPWPDRRCRRSRRCRIRSPRSRAERGEAEPRRRASAAARSGSIRTGHVGRSLYGRERARSWRARKSKHRSKRTLQSGHHNPHAPAFKRAGLARFRQFSVRRPCDADHRRFGQQCHTEPRMHRVAHLARQLEQRGGRAAAQVNQRERVRGRNADRRRGAAPCGCRRARSASPPTA